MVEHIRHVGIVVRHLDTALHFYRDLLGFQVIKTMHESGPYLDRILSLKGVQVTTVKLAAQQGPTLIELLEFKVPPSEEKKQLYFLGLTHIALTVKNLDKFYLQLSQAGVRFNAPPQLSPDGYAKVTYCYDPEGTAVELVEVLEK